MPKNKNPSITIDYLRENYVHVYKTYRHIETSNGSFVSPIEKTDDKTLHLLLRVNSDWQIKRLPETEEVLQKRLAERRFQYTGTHNNLDKFERIRDLQTTYAREEQTRMTKILKQRERTELKRRIKRNEINVNSESDDLARELKQEIEVDEIRNNLIRKMLKEV